MRKRVIPKNGWKRKAGALAGVALVTGIFVTGSTPKDQAMVPIAAHAEAAAPNGEGYWTVTSSGKVYAYGRAQLYGDMADHKLNAPIVGIIAAPDGKGYWLVGKDGGIFSFGSARFQGSKGNGGITGVVGGASVPGTAGSSQDAAGPAGPPALLAPQALPVRPAPQVRREIEVPRVT